MASSSRYAVSSVESKTTYHRTKTGANKEYFRRYHRGDRETTIDDLQTGQRVKRSTSKIVSPSKRGSYTFSGGEYKRNSSDLAQEAWAAGRDWFRIGQHSSGVANARVVKYGYSKWWNNQSPQKTAGHSKGGKLERAFREGWNRAKMSARTVNPGGTRYRGVITAIPGHLLRGGKKQVKSSWFNSKKEAHDWVYAMEQPGVETHHIERGATTIRRSGNPEDPYYWRKEGSLWVLRQKRFKHLLDSGKREHPHDIMAYARTPEEKKSMYRTITGRDQEQNPGPKRYPTKKKPGDPTYSAQWSGVTGAPKIKGKVCARCGGKVHREAGSAYCPYCDDYVQTVTSNPSGSINLNSAKKILSNNPNRLVDVIVRQNGKTFKAKAKYDAVQRRVRVFVNPKVAAKVNPESSGKPRLTPEQKKALAAYNFALQQEDRYLGSVFVTPTGQRRVEAVTKEAYDRCKRLGMDHRHGL